MIVEKCKETVEKVTDFPSLAGNNCSPPRRVWLVTSRLGTGKSLNFFTVCENVLTISGLEKIFFTGKTFGQKKQKKGKGKKNVGDDVIGRVFGKNKFR
jgi:hypothetical protein